MEINIGKTNSPQMIKIGTITSHNEKKEIENLIREFKDIFTWSYDDLKAYSGELIKHTIPFQEGVKPYRQSSKTSTQK